MKPNIPFCLTGNYYFWILRNKKYYREHSLIALPETGTCRLLTISRIENYFHVFTYKEFGSKVTFLHIEHNSVSGGHPYWPVTALWEVIRVRKCPFLPRPAVRALCRGQRGWSANAGQPRAPRVREEMLMSCLCGKRDSLPSPFLCSTKSIY